MDLAVECHQHLDCLHLRMTSIHPHVVVDQLNRISKYVTSVKTQS
jgi:hypothetical protein